MKKPRKFERKHLTCYLKVYDRKTNQLVGRLCDITPEGIMLLSEEPIGTQITFSLRVAFHREIEGREYLDIEARSLWVKKDVLPNFYNAGFQLLENSQDHQQFIERLVSEFGAKRAS